jgi:hypothetical protein
MKFSFYPLSYFPQGGKENLAPSPWGKVGKGVRKIKK